MVFVNVGSLTAQPGRRDEVVAILLESDAQLASLGCLQYDVGVNDDEPDVIHVVERWVDADAHAASLQSPAVRSQIERAMPLLTPAMSGTQFTVVGSPLR